MHPGLRTSIRSARTSLLLALGLASACGDSEGTTAASATSEGGTGTTGDTTQAPSTGETAGNSATTSSGSGSGSDGTTSGSTTSATTTTAGTTSGTSSGTGPDTTTGTTSGTTSGTTGDTTSGTTGVDPECDPLVQGFTDPPVPSGWVQCPGKLPHRVSAVKCEVPAAPAKCALDEPNQPCHTNADCDEQPFGSCQQVSIGLITCGCIYGCETDADCEAGFVCRCGGDVLGPTSTCVPSGCVDDDACADGEVCQFAHSHGTDCPLEVVDGNCSTPDDLCDSDQPCGGDPCTFNGASWTCTGLICGRPFYVDDEAVTAAPVAAEGWSVGLAIAPAPAELRPALAEYWTTIALAEHASIASFARHVLQLLAVGAPASLVQAAHEALADEVEHARLGFALASHHRGAAVGPGPLARTDAPLAQDLEAVVVAVIREACVGETLSALEVEEAAARADDPALRRILARIADDERRHAELGWRFLAWALPRLDADAQGRAHAALAAAVDEAGSAARSLALELGAPELRPHGVVDAPLRAAVHLEGLRGLVMPVAEALRAAA